MGQREEKGGAPVIPQLMPEGGETISPTPKRGPDKANGSTKRVPSVQKKTGGGKELFRIGDQEREKKVLTRAKGRVLRSFV